MLTSFARFRLQSRISRDNVNRKKQFLPWEKIEKIGLILHQADNINKSSLDKFLEGTKRNIHVFYVDLAAKHPPFADWSCFTKKDVTLLGLPRQTVLSELKKQKFDLVINTCGDTELFATALVSAFTAPFKCGNSRAFNDVDLIIKKTEPYHVVDYLNEVLRYLNMIKV